MTHAMKRWPLRPILALVWLVGLVFAVSPARAAAITVTATGDDILANANCTLREAIIAANEDRVVDACSAGSGPDTISLPAGTYVLSRVGTGEDAAGTGDLDITDDLVIIGAGRTATTIDAGGVDRIFEVVDVVGAQVALTIVGTRLTGGTAGGNGGAIRVNDGSLTLDGSRVHANTTTGIWADSSGVTLVNSRVDNNTDGGVVLLTSSTATIRDSDISQNTRAGSSGGGGLALFGGTATLVNVTISGNTANGFGGGIFTNSGDVHLYNATVANNSADADGDGSGDGGGVFNAFGALLTARNTILSGNIDGSASTQHPDCSGALTSEGYNLITVTTGCAISGNLAGNLIGLSANLGPLQLNGADTRTQGLLSGSPAIDAGDPVNWCVDQHGALLQTDQRGFVRNGLCDIGAYEYLSAGTPTATVPPVASATATRTRTASPSPTWTATATAPSTSTATGSATPNAGATATRTATPTATATATQTATAGPSPTATRTPTTTYTATAGPSPTATLLAGSPTPVPSATSIGAATSMPPTCSGFCLALPELHRP